MHTFVHKFVHTFVHTFVYTYVCTFGHIFLHTFIHTIVTQNHEILLKELENSQVTLVGLPDQSCLNLMGELGVSQSPTARPIRDLNHALVVVGQLLRAATPQGLVISTLLFILAIDNIVKAIGTDNIIMYYSLYGDDLAICIRYGQ